MAMYSHYILRQADSVSSLSVKVLFPLSAPLSGAGVPTPIVVEFPAFDPPETVGGKVVSGP